MGWSNSEVINLDIEPNAIRLVDQVFTVLRFNEAGEIRRVFNSLSSTTFIMGGNFPGPVATPGATFGNVYSVAIPNGIMTSQGLA